MSDTTGREQADPTDAEIEAATPSPTSSSGRRIIGDGEYTPTMDEVRTAYKAGGGYRWPERGEQFDRWLDAHDRELRERIAREMLSDDAIGHGYARLMAPRRGEHPVATFSAAVQTVISNAAQIARGEGAE